MPEKAGLRRAHNPKVAGSNPAPAIKISLVILAKREPRRSEALVISEFVERMSNARGRTGRIPRERATAHVVELLERVCEAEGAAACVTAVYAFGSWSRGALEVGDVDLDIEYDRSRDPATAKQMLDLLVAGRDWTSPLRKALKPRRTLQVLFESIDKLGEPVVIYQDGDDLEAALARVNAITSDPSAGRAERDSVHPKLEPVADALSRPSLITLSELMSHGLITVSVLDLMDVAMSEIHDDEFREFLLFAWDEGGPRARAARAAGVYLLGRGLQLSDLAILERKPAGRSAGATWAVEAREGKLRNFAYDLGQGFDGWLYVVQPERKKPLRGLEITAAAGSALRDDAFELDAWLLAHAPQIQQIG
jgi:hypothetical protein